MVGCRPIVAWGRGNVNPPSFDRSTSMVPGAASTLIMKLATHGLSVCIILGELTAVLIFGIEGNKKENETLDYKSKPASKRHD